MKVVIAGASGFMGRYLVEAFRGSGDEVSTIGRGAADARWGDADGLRSLVDGTDLVLNLAGKSVNCRYHAANRAEILRSRVDTTRELGAAIEAASRPPAVWLNSSTATIYRHAEDRAMTEAAGELGSGFSVGVARAWEEAFFERDLPGTRRVALRTAIVLGDGGALAPLLGLARIGFGGPQVDGPWFRSRRRVAAGTFHEYGARGGRQRFSWVHLEDVLGIIRFLIAHPELDGVVNVSAPDPVDSVTVMRRIRRAIGMPFGLPLHRWLLEPGGVGHPYRDRARAEEPVGRAGAPPRGGVRVPLPGGRGCDRGDRGRSPGEGSPCPHPQNGAHLNVSLTRRPAEPGSFSIPVRSVLILRQPG